jgi:hypothetical protein
MVSRLPAVSFRRSVVSQRPSHGVSMIDRMDLSPDNLPGVRRLPGRIRRADPSHPLLH